MKSVNYYVCSCLNCNKIVLVKVDFMDFNEECCLDFKNLKILKNFNDEQEARNYMKIVKNEED